MTVPMFFDAFYFKVQVAAFYQRQGGNIAMLFGSVKRLGRNIWVLDREQELEIMKYKKWVPVPCASKGV